MIQVPNACYALFDCSGGASFRSFGDVSRRLGQVGGPGLLVDAKCARRDRCGEGRLSNASGSAPVGTLKIWEECEVADVV